MKFVDYNYIATMIGDFSRVPVHIYKNNELIFYYSITHFIKDPISIHQSDILKISDHIGYLLTDKDRKSTRLNSSHDRQSRMPSSA